MIPPVLDPALVGTEDITQVWVPDPLLLQACQLRARTTTKMQAVKWPLEAPCENSK